jgi:hypothetical protein
MENISLADLQKFRQATLEYHNTYRQMHHAPPLVNYAEFDKAAQAYAEKMAKSGIFAHAPATERNGAGENLYISPNNEVNDAMLAELSKEVIDCFYNEIKDYDFKKPVFSMSTKYFTQLVWRESIGNNGSYVVARYGTSGNYDRCF